MPGLHEVAWFLKAGGLVVLELYAPWQHHWMSLDAGWVLLGFLTAVALTFSPGPARGLALVLAVGGLPRRHAA